MQRAPTDFPKREETQHDPFGTAPPFNLEAEHQLIGALLLRNGVLDDIEPFDASHFFDPLHAQIYEAIVSRIRSGRPALGVDLTKQFEGYTPIGTETVPAYILRSAREVSTISNAREYARIIRNCAIRRNLVLIGEDLSLAARETALDVDPKELIEEVEARLYSLAYVGKPTELHVSTFGDACVSALANAQADKVGIQTGFADLDEMLCGFQPSDLIICAGRPGMGKTALATNIGFNVAKNGLPVDFYSLEMSAEQLAARVMASEAGVGADRFRKGKITDNLLKRLQDAYAGLQSLPLMIDQTGGISIAQLTARARRNKRKRGTKLIIVDYLQLMQASKRRNSGNRVEDITEITTGLKALAKELNVPILALSQLSRNVEHREGKRPQLSDLRESGSIEQDADVVMFVFREEYYIRQVEPGDDRSAEYTEWQKKVEQAKGKADVIIGKHRHGPTGTLSLAFTAELAKFDNLAKAGVRHGV